MAQGQYPNQYFEKVVSPSVRSGIYKVISRLADYLAVTDTVNSIIDWIEGKASLIVQDIAELRALDTNAQWIPNGSTAYVVSLETYFTFDSTINADIGLLAVQSSNGNGTWLRDLSFSNFKWQAQSNWYIDSAAGSDENSGIAQTAPLQTFAELRNRLSNSTIPIVMTVHITNGTIPESDYPAFDYLPDGSNVLVQGTRTRLGPPMPGEMSFTAVQPIAHATNDALEVECTNLNGVSWTAAGFIYNMVQIFSGPRAGAVAFVLVDLGGANKRARLSPFIDLTTYNVITPQVGDEFRVYQLTQFDGAPGVSGLGTYNAKVRFQYCWFHDITYDYAVGKAIDGATWFEGCKLQGWMQLTGGQTTIAGCGLVEFMNLDLYNSASCSLWSCGLQDDSSYISIFSETTKLFVTGDTIFQSGSVIYAPVGGNITVQNTASFDSQWDTIGLGPFCNLNVQDALYGEGNTNNIIYFGAWSVGVYETFAALTAVSAAAVLDFGGTTKGWADLPFVNSNDAAFPVPAGNQSGFVLSI